MEQEDMPCWVDSFAEFCARFDDLFARSESREQAHTYMRGLLAPLERKTNWLFPSVFPSREQLTYKQQMTSSHPEV